MVARTYNIPQAHYVSSIKNLQLLINKEQTAILKLENLSGLQKVANKDYDCKYLATTKDGLDKLQDYTIIGEKPLLKDIDYLITNKYTFFLYFNHKEEIVFEW